ncbi:exodeoxyribonuclease VII large subunit [Mariprofundus erugo]|uniref:exodeoxyribonuclease VII large subunit n=1 Tax=Mariprofundus erugo TaxID=2528639 RepID=UPI001EE7D517|nr:exodeoxyribonuclease VII large subunit [Mariprofundus erugo]
MSDAPLSPVSVTQLTARIKQMLEQGFANVAVSGEVSRLTRPSSGHLYFTIKDAHAAIAAVVWRSTALRLREAPEEGGEYIFTGHISLYEPRGSYQLVVTRIEAAGAGQLAAEFERRKQRFAGYGWFEPGRKHPVPPLPHHIGIVTSATAAAYEDVKKVLATRPAWLQLTLSPCLVQGTAAPPTIARALQALIDMPAPPELILLVRGGGSIEDLWCFNDEAVVRAIAESPIPIMTGIGHEIDITLADFAASQRAATPSNAAELACPSRQELHRRLPKVSSMAGILRQRLNEYRHRSSALAHRLQHAWQRRTDGRHHRCEQLHSRLSHQRVPLLQQRRERLRAVEKRLAAMEPGRQLHQQRHRLSQRVNQLHQVLHHDLQRKTGHARQTQQSLLLAGRDLLPPQKQQLLPLTLRLGQLRADFIPDRKQLLTLFDSRLRNYDKQDILARGYSLNYDEDDKLITRIAQLQPGALLRVEFQDGSAAARIESTKRIPT